MCGIGGLLHPTNATATLQPLLPHLQAALQHRGPDDTGTFISGDGQAGFVHARLAVIDLSAAGHQPMFALDGRYTLIFNGEIYNYRALARELEAQGVMLRTQSDTEVVVLLYHLLGPDCVKRFQGMFAFAIWDGVEKTCFMARDPLGIKPFYYAHRADGVLAFASELRALLATGIVPKQLDADGLLSFFLHGSVAEPRTLVAGALCLEAGHWMLWRAGRLRTECFWKVPFAEDQAAEVIGANADVAYVRQSLLETMDRHFVADVPVGLFLSGGIDSTALVALARAQGRENLRTYSLSFDEAEFNEGESARRTAEHFGTQHTDYRLTGREARDLFQKFLQQLDQPSVDGFNTYAISKVAREAGAKVVLSGLGGDELFGSYPSFQRVPRMLQTASLLGPARPLVAAGLRAWPGHPRFARLGDFLAGTPTVGRAVSACRGIYSQAEALALTAHFLAGAAAPALPNKAASNGVPRQDDARVRASVGTHEVTHYMRNQLLRDSDVASMAWGLELRVPLVDSKFYEDLAGILPARRLRPGKTMLLDAVPEIPDWIAGGAKRGFSFPFARWLDEDWKGVFGDDGGPIAGVRLKTWYQRWSLFVFRRWWEM